ncbi:MAG: deaminase, partial [Arenibacterium sp.]
MSDLDSPRQIIVLADEAVREGNQPFGAVLVSATGEVLASGKNIFSVDRGRGHAEANLAREAARRFDVETLRGATLYTSV